MAEIEGAEYLAQIIAGEDLELTGFSVRMRDALVARIKARDAAVALAAKLEGKRELLEELLATARRWQDLPPDQTTCPLGVMLVAAIHVRLSRYAAPTEESR